MFLIKKRSSADAHYLLPTVWLEVQKQPLADVLENILKNFDTFQEIICVEVIDFRPTTFLKSISSTSVSFCKTSVNGCFWNSMKVFVDHNIILNLL